MTDSLHEERISFSALAAREGVNASTVWRWALGGCRGVKLESFSVGGRRFTTSEAFARFVAATSAVAQRCLAPSSAALTSDRAAAIRRAEAELDQAGV